jgi:hypothetical protein
MAQKGAIGNVKLITNRVVTNPMASVSDNQYTTLTGLGYTGSISDMERKDFLTKLGLVEPQFQSHADLEMAYLGSLGKTGSLADRQHN